MPGSAKRFALRAVSPVLPERARTSLLRTFNRSLKKQFTDRITDAFLELLLSGMDIAFALFPDYRKNIKGFSGVCTFKTRDDGVGVSAVFEDGDMRVARKPVSPDNICVTFKDAEVLRAYLFSEDQDVLKAVLQNDLDVEGNLNYIYRFGYLSRVLTSKLGIA